MRSAADLLHLLIEVAPEEIRRDLPGRDDFCVLGTRLAHDVLHYFGVESKPVVVQVLAFNAAAMRWVEEHGPGVSDEDVEAYNAAGAHVVAIDEEDRGSSRFPGHLVLHVPAERVLVDLSVGQFARPERGIIVSKAALFDVPDHFFGEGGVVVYGLERGGALLYEYRRRAAVDFHTAADWKRTNPATGRVIRRLQESGIPGQEGG